MPRPSRSTPEILAEAVEMVCESGWAGVSARSLAQRVGCSTMPIYSAFGSIAGLEDAVRGAVLERLREAQRQERTGTPLVDMALGYLAFARDEPRLYSFLFVERPLPVSTEQWNAREGIEAVLGPGSVPESFFGSVPSRVDRVAFRSWVFLHGLASLLASGAVTGIDDDELRELVVEAGGAFHMFEVARGGKG